MKTKNESQMAKRFYIQEIRERVPPITEKRPLEVEIYLEDVIL